MTHFPPGVGFPKPFQTGAPQNFSEWLLIPLYKHLPAENKPTPPSHLIQFRNSPQTSRGLQTTGWQPQPSPLKRERTLQSINPPTLQLLPPLSRGGGRATALGKALEAAGSSCSRDWCQLQLLVNYGNMLSHVRTSAKTLY